MANQYRDAISIFSYAAPRATQPVTVTIAPSPGVYGIDPIFVTFSNAGGERPPFFIARARMMAGTLTARLSC